jgi:4-amino-4-deoxy-L-arabinose transferase-like glycosyltransferase
MESGLVARNGGRAGLVALVAILLLGVGLRVGYAWDGRPPVYDAQAYAAIAANLDRGDGFTVGPGATQPSSNYSPGLPLAVAAVYEVTGGVHERTARVVLALVASLAVLFAYLIGRRLGRAAGGADRGGVVAGLIGALAVAIYPAFLEYGGMLMSEPLAATLLSGAVLGMFWARDGEGVWRWLVPGLALGALAMLRPEYLAVGVLLAVAVALIEMRSHFLPDSEKKCERRWRGWCGVARGALIVVGMAVVVAPWTVRNAVALDRFVPISTGGGQVLYAGTYLPSDGDPEKVGAEVVAENPELFSPADATQLRLEQILTRLAAHTYPGLESDEALSRMGREQLWDDVSEEPLEYAGFVATKVGRIWSHGPRDVMREPLWEALHWALVGFGLVGLMLLAWRRRWEALVLATVFLSITAISALLVASPRRVLVMIPLVAACAGFGAAWTWACVKGRAWRRPERADAAAAGG